MGEACAIALGEDRGDVREHTIPIASLRARRDRPSDASKVAAAVCPEEHEAEGNERHRRRHGEEGRARKIAWLESASWIRASFGAVAERAQRGRERLTRNERRLGARPRDGGNA